MKVSVEKSWEEISIPPHPCGTPEMQDHVERFELPGVFGWSADNYSGYAEKQHLEMPEGELHLVSTEYI